MVFLNKTCIEKLNKFESKLEIDIEKNIISEELHDGILGRLLGARLSLDSLN